MIPELPETARNGKPSHSRTSRAPFRGREERENGNGIGMSYPVIQARRFGGFFLWVVSYQIDWQTNLLRNQERPV
jgi:hypothetical protein